MTDVTRTLALALSLLAAACTGQHALVYEAGGPAALQASLLPVALRHGFSARIAAAGAADDAVTLRKPAGTAGLPAELAGLAGADAALLLAVNDREGRVLLRDLDNPRETAFVAALRAALTTALPGETGFRRRAEFFE